MLTLIDMKSFRLCIILLTLVIAAMVMIPMASATDVILEKGIQTNENIKNLQPSNTRNIFNELGLQRPQRNEKIPLLKTYNESKTIADKVMKEANISNDTENVIGTYDFGKSQMLLLKHGDQVIEAFYDGKTTTTYTLTPHLLGNTTIIETPRKIAGFNENNFDYTITTSTQTQLDSISFISPKTGDALVTSINQPSTYIVTRTRTDEYRNYLGEIRASLTSKGTFYVNYGSSITGITDLSSYYTTYPYTTCSVNTHLKTGSAFARAQVDNWVSCDAWLTTNDGGPTSTWMSGNGDGCTG
jgi:hypothetical protein